MCILMDRLNNCISFSHRALARHTLANLTNSIYSHSLLHYIVCICIFPNSLAPLIGKFCGSDIPPPIHSFGNQLYLKFTSDSSRNGKGFELVWDGTLTGCGGVITSSKGKFYIILNSVGR